MPSKLNLFIVMFVCTSTFTEIKVCHTVGGGKVDSVLIALLV